jgi:hypothetical protein
MFKFTATTWIFSIICVFLCPTLCLALVIINVRGLWPESWPKELEPYRKQAKTYEIGTGTQENAYEINFKDREEFEEVWPTVLKLKSKGAPLILRSIEPFKSGSLFNNEQPVIRIYGPVHPAYGYSRPGGKMLRPGPPWPESIKSPRGELPEYVTISEDGNSWVAVQEIPPIEKVKGFLYRARIEIELVVDGNIIDLNRIHLPADTPIIDKRTLSDKQQSFENHTEWVSECINRIQSIKLGSSRAELLKVFTTEGGLSTRSQRTYVYRDCPYIKVDVKFKAVDNDKYEEKPDDIITEISKPYLQWSIMN